MRLSFSAVQTFQTCPRLYKHQYVNKMRPIKRPLYYVLGGAVHRFIDIFYSTRDVKMAADACAREFDAVDRSLMDTEEVHDLECQKAIGLGICEAYPQFYMADFDQYKTFMCEKEGTIKIGTNDKHEYYGKLDCLIQDHAGDWWLLETKTAAQSTVNADYFNRVQIDSQVSGYMHIAKDILSFFPRGVIYNVIKKPGIRLKKGEGKGEFQHRVFMEYKQFAQEKGYFTRQELIIGDIQLRRWKANIDYLVEMIANSKKFPMNTGACTSAYGSCSMLKACIGGNYNPLLYRKDSK